MIVNQSASGLLGLCRNPEAGTGITHAQLLGVRAPGDQNTHLGVVQRLIVDEDGVYDPRSPNDRLLLGMKGSISEFELGVLRARMLASHEAWRTLQRQRSEEAKAVQGSFDGRTARLIFEFDTGFGRVNRNDSVNRNPGGDIHMAVAGTSRTGGRG